MQLLRFCCPLSISQEIPVLAHWRVGHEMISYNLSSKLCSKVWPEARLHRCVLVSFSLRKIAVGHASQTHTTSVANNQNLSHPWSLELAQGGKFLCCSAPKALPGTPTNHRFFLAEPPDPPRCDFWSPHAILQRFHHVLFWHLSIGTCIKPGSREKHVSGLPYSRPQEGYARSVSMTCNILSALNLPKISLPWSTESGASDLSQFPVAKESTCHTRMFWSLRMASDQSCPCFIAKSYRISRKTGIEMLYLCTSGKPHHFGEATHLLPHAAVCGDQFSDFSFFSAGASSNPSPSTAAGGH